MLLRALLPTPSYLTCLEPLRSVPHLSIKRRIKSIYPSSLSPTYQVGALSLGLGEAGNIEGNGVLDSGEVSSVSNHSKLCSREAKAACRLQEAKKESENRADNGGNCIGENEGGQEVSAEML